jgi:hypothetical protein
MKTGTKLLLGFFIILVLVQFIRPKRNLSAQTSRNDINLLYPVPGNVKAILKKACNDCHSNNTRYPWYANIQPVAWWLDDHVQEGKQHLNFSEFASYRLRKQYHKLEEVAETVEKGEMPLNSYSTMHKDADLTNQEKQLLIGWSKAVRDTMKARFPIDSLMTKK